MCMRAVYFLLFIDEIPTFVYFSRGGDRTGWFGDMFVRFLVLILSSLVMYLRRIGLGIIGI